MRKLLFGFSVLFISISFVGCGSGGDIGSSANTATYDYDLWEYIGTNSTSNLNVSWDKYTLDDNNNTTATSLNDESLTRFYNTKKVSEEIGSDNNNDVYWYELYENDNNYISRGLLSSSYGLLKRYADIGDNINFWYNYDCKLTEHKDLYNPQGTYTYNDVLIFDCSNSIKVYQKNIGQVTTITKDTNSHFIYVLENN